MGLPKGYAQRKAIPVCTGVLDYFPDALAAVAHCSVIGNDQHNKGQPLHWAKEKSSDEADALVRHLLQRGTVDIDGVRHSAKVSWRALALLQRELEAEGKEIKFGKKTVLGVAGRKQGRVMWRVRCDCGREFECPTCALGKRLGGCRFCAFKGPRLSRRKRPYEYRYLAIAHRTRHPVYITYEEFFEFTKVKECHYCGEQIDWGPAFGRGRLTGSNIDRKDSNLPYQNGNLVVACRRCNYGKNNFFSYEEWMQLAVLIRSWREARDHEPPA